MSLNVRIVLSVCETDMFFRAQFQTQIGFETTRAVPKHLCPPKYFSLYPSSLNQDKDSKIGEDSLKLERIVVFHAGQSNIILPNIAQNISGLVLILFTSMLMQCDRQKSVVIFVAS